MKNLFTEHPRTKGQTYFGHLLFASSIALRLMLSAFAFILHGVLPFIPIAHQFNLEAVASFLLQENYSIGTRWRDQTEEIVASIVSL